MDMQREPCDVLWMEATGVLQEAVRVVRLPRKGTGSRSIISGSGASTSGSMRMPEVAQGQIRTRDRVSWACSVGNELGLLSGSQFG